MFHVVRFALCGAAAAVIVSGAFGLDAFLPDIVAAFIGGTATGVLAKLSILV